MAVSLRSYAFLGTKNVLSHAKIRLDTIIRWLGPKRTRRNGSDWTAGGGAGTSQRLGSVGGEIGDSRQVKGCSFGGLVVAKDQMRVCPCRDDQYPENM